MFARIENGEIVDTLPAARPGMRVWVEEPIYDEVDVFRTELRPTGEVDPDTGEPVLEEVRVYVGSRPEPTGETHVVEATVSVPAGYEATDAEMAAWGWTPVREERPPHDPATQRLVGPTVVVEGGDPVARWTVEDLPPPPPAPGPTAEERLTATEEVVALLLEDWMHRQFGPPA